MNPNATFEPASRWEAIILAAESVSGPRRTRPMNVTSWAMRKSTESGVEAAPTLGVR